MTLNEALRELGVDLPCTAEQVRRGYLRRLKGCKPERDPAGFRRLRESYELVLGLAGQSGFREPQEPPELPEPQEPLAPLELSEPPETVEPSLAVAREGAAEPERADGGELAEWGWEAGPRFETFTDAELDELTADCPRQYVAALARERYCRNQWLAAAACVSRLLDPDPAGEEQAEAGAELPPCALVLDVVLLLLTRGEPATAADLWTRYREQLGRAGREAEAVRGDVARWAVTRELIELGADFPHEALALMAYASLRGDPAHARWGLDRLAWLRPVEAAEAASLLPKGSLLRATYHAALAGLAGEAGSVRRAPPHPTFKRYVYLGMMVVVGSWIVMIGIKYEAEHEKSEAAVADAIAPHVQAAAPVRSQAPAPPRTWRQVFGDACPTRTAEPESDVCRHALAVLRAVEGAAKPDCDAARDELLYLHAALLAEREGHAAAGTDLPNRLWTVALVREARSRCAPAGAVHLSTPAPKRSKAR
jgi:hypothetical protein